MKKLLTINKMVYILILILIIMFISLIIFLLNIKIEKSQSFILRADSSGNSNILASAEDVIKLKSAKTMIVKIGNHSFETSIKSILPPSDKNTNYIITLKGVGNLLPKEKIRVSIIYGHESIIGSLISSGV